jgi:hypothetical protein
VGVSEHDMIMEIPEEHFSMKSRRKSSSNPSSSRRRKGVPTYVDTSRKGAVGKKSSQNNRSSSRSKSRIAPESPSSPNGPESPAGPGFLNPISKEDLKLTRSRQRPALVVSQIKKLEDGLNLVSYRGVKRGLLVSISKLTYHPFS